MWLADVSGDCMMLGGPLLSPVLPAVILISFDYV